MIGVRQRFTTAFACAFLLLGIASTVAAKPWRGIIPLRSKRSDVRRVLGKPAIGTDGVVELYQRKEGRIQVRYARRPCEEGLPADWGNWRVSKDTVVNISITLNEEIPVKKLRIQNIERFKWYTGESGATYYVDRRRGIEYQVQDELVTAIAYGPMARDLPLRCRKNVPLMRY